MFVLGGRDPISMVEKKSQILNLYRQRIRDVQQKWPDVTTKKSILQKKKFWTLMFAKKYGSSPVFMADSAIIGISMGLSVGTLPHKIWQPETGTVDCNQIQMGIAMGWLILCCIWPWIVWGLWSFWAIILGGLKLGRSTLGNLMQTHLSLATVSTFIALWSWTCFKESPIMWYTHLHERVVLEGVSFGESPYQ